MISLTLQKLKIQPWFWPLIGLIAALLLGTTLELSHSSSRQDGSEFEIDTFIPKGYVLVPISVHNSENMDSIFGSFAMIDLYAVSSTGIAQSQAILKNVKLLRAPKNPSQFGVLVPETLSSLVVRKGPLFAVTVLNPKSSGTTLEFSSPPRTRRVILEGREE